MLLYNFKGVKVVQWIVILFCSLFSLPTTFSFHIGIRRTSSLSTGVGGKDTIASLLASLMEVVRTTVACECVYVRAMVIKALIWMQSPHDSFDQLESIIASELSDPAWPATLLNDILLTLHARFKVCVDKKVTHGVAFVWKCICVEIFIYMYTNLY